jgi:polyisoprenoid-binding protein YceI
MKITIVYIALFFASVAAFAQTKHKVTGSKVSYQVKNMGFMSSGNIAGFEATILFDKDHTSTSSIEASVDTHTLDSDNEMRDTHLKKEEYFDTDHFPKIVMKSVSFKAKSASNYIGQFNVTIKGKTKLIELPFTYVTTGNLGAFKGSFKINRLDFGIGDKSMVLANEVAITLNVETAF